MVFGWIALTSMRSSALYGVGISRPRCLVGSALRLLGRVRLLLRLRSSERSVGTFGAGSLCGFVGILSVVPSARLEWFPYAYLQRIFIKQMHKCIVMFVCVMGYVVLDVAFCGVL